MIDVSDTEMQEGISLVASTVSETLLLMGHRPQTRDLAIADFDAPIAKYPAAICLKGAKNRVVQVHV